MHDLLEFAVLGIGTGAIYALMGQSIVLIYRASGILNFSQGATAMAGAFIYYELSEQHADAPLVAAIVAVAGLSLDPPVR